MPLSKESRRMACFEWGDQIFENRILAFGLPSAPGYYQMMNLVGINFLRRNGIKITLYLDDRLLIVTPKSENHRKKLLSGEEVGKEVWITAAVLAALGGYVNIAKSEFMPTQRIEFLGFILDTDSETVEIPPGRWIALKERIQKAKANAEPEVKLLERIRGTMASMAAVFPNMRMIIRQTTLLILKAEMENKIRIAITPEVEDEWNHWLNFESKGLARKWTRQTRIDAGILVYTDASNHAGAIVIEEWNLSEKFAWNEDTAEEHICIKEALAILYAVKWFAPSFSDRRVTFLCDNSSVVQGAISGSKDPKMNKILVDIWATALKNRIDLKVEWVSTKNQRADDPSRIIDTREQQITDEGFACLQSRLSETLNLDVAATV